MSKSVAPFGSWRSPLTVEMMAGRSIGLGDLRSNGDRLFWLESRPYEGGRTVLMAWREDTGTVELTPAPADVRSRVHEYGGGAYAVSGELVVYSDKASGAVRLIDLATPDRAARTLVEVAGCRYADFAFDLARNRVLAIREDHRDRPPTAPINSIVAFALDGTIAPAENAGALLVSGCDFYAAPRPSPDGNRLAWIEWDHPNMPWDDTRLNVAMIEADGGVGPIESSQGGSGHPESITQPEWLHATTLAFCSDRSGWWQPYRWPLNAAPAPLCADDRTGHEIGGPAWSFAAKYFTLLDGGSLLAVSSSNALRTAVHIVDGVVRSLPLGAVSQAPVTLRTARGAVLIAALVTPADRSPSIQLFDGLDASVGRILASASADVLDPADISHGEALDFETADGSMAHANFYPPVNAHFHSPDELPPLIVVAHGGPTGMNHRVYSAGIQWWTTRGFAVVDVNYRGSTGYGRPYRDALQGQWGLADVEDCAAAVRHLSQTGRVDPKRVAIRGGSAGGFTVLAALTTTDLFATGASHYGVADLMLLAQDTHKFEARYLEGLVGPLPGAEAIFAERSPLNHLDRLSVPIIVFQGLEDRVVPPNQAEAIVDALKSRGIPVAYYAFEGEGHGFRQASTIRRVLDLELSFFGRIFGFEPYGVGERVVLSTDA